jgi:hypothetical protein
LYFRRFIRGGTIGRFDQPTPINTCDLNESD